MNKSINILWTTDISITTRSFVEQIINTWEDFAYAYDLTDEATERICEILNELDIQYTIEETDI
jgi:hypothetical protein